MTDIAFLITGLLIGTVIGGLTFWILAARKFSKQVAELQVAKAKAEAEFAAQEKLIEEHRRVRKESEETIQASHEKALADLREAFKALSTDALRQTQPEFLRLANETLGKFQESAKGDLNQRHQAIHALVKPLEDQLKQYQQRLQQSENQQSASLGEVKKHLETLATQSKSLATETVQLRQILNSNQARGRWGEETLRRVVEAAGMSAHCDFSEQVQSGESKPDMVVHLPGDRMIIVDSKVPDLDFLNDIHLSDDQKRSEFLAAHAAKLKTTIKSLNDRNYPAQFPNALDYVVLFLPAESLFSAALEGDRDLILWAQNRRILLATPTSLIALLQSVRLSWQQNEQSKNAQKIAEAAQELYNRVRTFTEHLGKIRTGLDRANDAFNKAVGSYERSIRPSGERIIELSSAEMGKNLEEIQPLNPNLRLPSTEVPSETTDLLTQK